MRERSSNKDSFARGADYLAIPLSGVMTFFVGPQLYQATVTYIAAYAASEFGNGWVWFFKFLWVICCAVGSFGLCLMLLAVTLRLGLAKIASLLAR